MFQSKVQCDSTFHDDCLAETVAPSLLKFVCMIEDGPDIKAQLLEVWPCYSTASTIQLVPQAQSRILSLQALKEPRDTFCCVCWQDSVIKDKEETTYWHAPSESRNLSSAVVAQYVKDGIVSPQFFMTSAVDNNLTATAAKSSFHGTSVSMFQHPSSEQPGEECEQFKLNTDIKAKKFPELPETFTFFMQTYITKIPNLSVVESHLYPAPESIQSHLMQEYTWLEEVPFTDKVDDAVIITWVAHHATWNRSQPF